MNHDEAVQLMATEKYLLNELTPEQREAFEAHFFECVDCAKDVRAGDSLVRSVKEVA
jgi:anti-sigma factor RsiW